METIETKIDEVTFDLISCLTLIGTDDALLSLFQQKFTTDLKVMVTLAKQGKIDSDAEKYIESIFDGVVIKRREYLNEYVRIFSKTTPTPQPTDEGVMPRRYGKQKILSDINKSGGKPTEIQRMMLEVNDLKNIVAKLNRKGRTQMLSDSDILTDKQCREVIGIIQTLKNKLKKEKIL